MEYNAGILASPFPSRYSGLTIIVYVLIFVIVYVYDGKIIAEHSRDQESGAKDAGNVMQAHSGGFLPTFVGPNEHCFDFVPLLKGTNFDKIMKDKPILLNSLLPLIVSVIGLPIFFVAFCLWYNPFDIKEYYSFGTFSDGFHITMLGCIILLVAIPSRLLQFRLSGKFSFPLLKNILWFLCEIFVIACFTALYTQLFRHNEGGWFQSLSDCLKFSFSILCYPVALMFLSDSFRSVMKGISISDENQTDETLVKLYDEHRRLKLTILPVNIVFVRAEANYVAVNYLESGKVKEYLLRNSMKTIEATLSKYGLQRCHRSFLINPKHITILAKDSDGFTYATLDTEGLKKIPVSKQYCDQLSALL